MKKKLIIVGILAVLSVPGLMWMYGYFGAKFEWFNALDAHDMNPISKHGARIVYESAFGW